jgi:tetratricopeptide (TPR) repeat protein
MDKEKQFLDLVARFPQNPMGHFSLGKLYLEQKRFSESAQALEKATTVDPTYAAALVALGEAYAGLGNGARARECFSRALETPHGRRDGSLAADIENRMRALD